ncbi:tellurite resistance TerB family protein [Paracoccus chinensis]|uniref:Uncharacterized membrane protein YebE, DUF533 family n=1 Tax=Paracoccus chinensis TaxID=525640 RepID=A0A1G9P1X8_9RHOB|nr:tellurite resistance TerB family protein [Paracoccus chinensis]SDL92639.1 Uncharacterized membrane protein YebE, DUF533 family [Paracoccus chinensis]
MSLMKSLARVAAGVMLAKGLGTMMQNQQQSRGGQFPGRRRTGGGILGDLMNAGSSRGSQGGLGDMLGQVLGGRMGGTGMGGAGTGRPYGGPNSAGASGGLGGILDSLTRNTGRGSAGGYGQGGGLLGGLAGGAAAGGLGGLLGGLLNGPAQRGAQPSNDASFGEVFNDAVARQDEPEVAPTPEQNAVAGLMLRAMIQAAKADGRIDEAERERLLGQLGDLDEDDRAFIRDQMAAPVDPQGLAREVPKGLESQVYLMSLMAIDFDSEQEAAYLHDLAEALGIDRAAANQIHDQVGVQNLYS